MGRKTGVALALAGLLMVGSNALAITPENQLTFDELMAGNARFAAGLTLDNLALKSQLAQRASTALVQTPKVIVLDCSDSRLSPEILFDKGLGELFVVRVAGNVIAPHQIASIEYAIEHLGAKMVVVLGHERCGGVTAAYGAFDATGTPTAAYTALTPNLKLLVDTMKPAVVATKAGTYLPPAPALPVTSVTTSTTATDCILNNAHITMNDLKVQSDVIATLLAKPVTDPLHDELLLVEAFYDLETGAVTVTRAAGNPLVPVTTIATTLETAIHTVNSAAGVGGTITPSGDSATVNGGSQKYVLAPAAGFSINGVTTTCPAGTLSGTNYTVSGVVANCSVTASFITTPTPPPTAVAIAPKGAGAAINPTYSFSAAAGATFYITYLYDSTVGTAAFGSWVPAATACATTPCQIPQVAALTLGHNYTWYVLPYNATGYGQWSQPASFRVGP
jgi:carbonic anhydrase